MALNPPLTPLDLCLRCALLLALLLSPTVHARSSNRLEAPTLSRAASFVAGRRPTVARRMRHASAAALAAPVGIKLAPSQLGALRTLDEAWERRVWDLGERAVLCSDWMGVMCGPHGMVTKLNIEGYVLAGSIPTDAFRNLTSLLELDMTWSSSLQGSLDFLGVLPSLQKLGLSNSDIFFPEPGAATNVTPMNLPSTFSRLTALSYLSLEYFNPVGPVDDLSTLSRLQHLSLEGLNLTTGELPSFFSTLTALTYLDLSHNRLTGPVPAALPSSLDTLDLSHNKLSGSIPVSISRLRSLSELSEHKSMHGERS
ncbi:hypothetical protein CLOP_g9174 [Closterium sp. NIES-67]|nr:hypothetical protein CLOP_g9174 [Closterium sp. NIES-67]